MRGGMGSSFSTCRRGALSWVAQRHLFYFRKSNSQTAPYELCLLGTSSSKEAVLAGNDQLPPGGRLRPGPEGRRTCPRSTGTIFDIYISSSIARHLPPRAQGGAAFADEPCQPRPGAWAESSSSIVTRRQGSQEGGSKEKGLPASQTHKPHAVVSVHSGAGRMPPPPLRCLVKVGTKYTFTIFISGKSTCIS